MKQKPDKTTEIRKEKGSGHETDGEGIYEVEQIVDHRQCGHQLELFVKWKGYTSFHNSWEPYSSLIRQAKRVVTHYLNQHPEVKPKRPAKRGRKLLERTRSKQQEQDGPEKEKLPKLTDASTCLADPIDDNNEIEFADLEKTARNGQRPAPDGAHVADVVVSSADQPALSVSTLSSSPSSVRRKDLPSVDAASLEDFDTHNFFLEPKLKPKRILNGLRDNRQPPRCLFVVEWQNGLVDLVLHEDARKRFPQLLIDFYEENLVWND